MHSSAPSAGSLAPPIMLFQNEQPVCEVLSLEDRGGLGFCYRQGFSAPLASGRELYIRTPRSPLANPAVSPVIEFAGDQKRWVLGIGHVQDVAGIFWSKVTFLHEIQ